MGDADADQPRPPQLFQPGGQGGQRPVHRGLRPSDGAADNETRLQAGQWSQRRRRGDGGSAADGAGRLSTGPSHHRGGAQLHPFRLRAISQSARCDGQPDHSRGLAGGLHQPGKDAGGSPVHRGEAAGSRPHVEIQRRRLQGVPQRRSFGGHGRE